MALYILYINLPLGTMIFKRVLVSLISLRPRFIYFCVFQGRYQSWLVGVVFGALSIITALLLIPLPETGNKSMPQTMDDVEKLARKKPNKNQLEVNGEIPLDEELSNEQSVI